MVEKTRADYIRHFYGNIYDNTVQGSIDPMNYIDLSNLGEHTLLPLGVSSYHRHLEGAIAELEIDAPTDFKEFSFGYEYIYPPNRTRISWAPSRACPCVGTNLIAIDCVERQSSYPFYYTGESRVFTFNTSPKIHTFSNNLHTDAVINVKRIKDVYDFNKISNIRTLSGNSLTKETFWNTFKEYFVPVNDDGSMLDFSLEKNYQYRHRFLNPIRLWNTNFPSPYLNYTTYEISALVDNIRIPLLKACWEGGIPGVGRVEELYEQGKRFHGTFDISSPFGLHNGTAMGDDGYDFRECYQGLPKEQDKIRYCIQSLCRDKTSGHIYYMYDMFGDIKGGFALPSRDDFSFEEYAPGTQLSREIDPNYGRYGLSDITTYYEDIDILDRSFEFEYEGEDNKLCIFSYNQHELENYLNVWGIPFSYVEGWVTPEDDPEMTFRKIRREDTILLTTATARKIRR